MKQLALIVVLVSVSNTCDVSAIVFSSSIGYYNYRQSANALAVYKYLRRNGLSDENIVLMIPQNSGCCEKNAMMGTVSFIDQQYQNINANIQIDNKFTNINLKTYANILRSKYPIYLLNHNKLKRTKRLLVYQTGHGGDFYFKIREREAILDQHYAMIFEELKSRDLYTSILLLSDSCSASTPFETVQADNFAAFASSSYNEKSLSHGFDDKLKIAKSDDFTFYLLQYLNTKNVRTQKIFLSDLQSYMTYDKLKVHSKIISNKKDEQINKYFKNKIKINKRKFMINENVIKSL